MFEVGLSGQMFDDLTIWDHLDAAICVGYRSVELRSTHVKPGVAETELKKIRSTLQDNGLTVNCLSCFVGNYGLLPDPECEKAFDLFKQYVDLACFFDSEMIRIWPAWQESAAAPGPVWDKAAAWLKRSAEYADPSRKKLVMEMHHGTLCDTAASSVKLLERIGAGNIGVTLDPVNLYQVPTGYGAEAIRTLGRYLFNVHVKDIVELVSGDYPYSFSYSYYARHIGRFTRVESPRVEKERYYCHRRINSGGIDWSHVLKSLKMSSYAGPLIIESVSETNRHMPSGKALAETCYRDITDLLEAIGLREL